MSYDRSSHPPDRPDLEFMADCIDAMTARMSTDKLGEEDAVVGAMLVVGRVCAIVGMRNFDVLVEQLRPIFETCCVEAMAMGAKPRLDLNYRDVDYGKSAPEPYAYRPGRIRDLVLQKLGRMGVQVFKPGTTLAEAQEKVGEHMEEVAREKWFNLTIDPPEKYKTQAWLAGVTCRTCCERDPRIDPRVRGSGLTKEAAAEDLQQKMVAHDAGHLAEPVRKVGQA